MEAVFNYHSALKYYGTISAQLHLDLTHFTMTISTKTNSTVLNYLSIIMNKTAEMIAMKIFRFVEVATLPHRHEK